MTSKTLGQIAKEAYGKELRKSQSWEAAASAIVEECAKVAEADDSFMMLQDWGLQNAVTQKGQNIAQAIRSLKSPSSDPGLKSPKGDTDGAEQPGIGLTQKSERALTERTGT